MMLCRGFPSLSSTSPDTTGNDLPFFRDEWGCGSAYQSVSFISESLAKKKHLLWWHITNSKQIRGLRLPDRKCIHAMPLFFISSLLILSPPLTLLYSNGPYNASSERCVRMSGSKSKRRRRRNKRWKHCLCTSSNTTIKHSRAYKPKLHNVSELNRV